MYILRVSRRCVEWRAGSILFDHCGGVGGGTVRILFLLWLCSGGYSTVEMVRGGVVRFFFLLSSVCCQFSWRLCICGRNLCVTNFVGSLVVFFRGFLLYKVLIVNNLLQVVLQESAS
jgi:hypothetical protein